MSNATMSILGLYNYGNYQNRDLFENMVMPDGIDRDTLIDTILEQCAEFEIIYTNFDYLQYSIGTWSKRWKRTFTKWAKALEIDYNPLENYDRIEEWEEASKGTTDTTGSGKASSKDNASSQSDDYVTAYNSDTLHQERRNVASSNGEQETDTSNNENIVTENNGTRKGRTHGNVGVTTSQQMLESELKIAEFNLIQQITDIFKQEFCILVY